MKRLVLVSVVMCALAGASIAARDMVLEFKAAAFVSTSETFRDIYGTAAAIYGPEFSVQLKEESAWYFFASIDYLSKKGHSIGLCEPTKVRFVPLGVGIKYVAHAFNCLDLYAGLGFQPINVRTTNCIDSIQQVDSTWAFGGIAKFGAWYHLPHHFLIDLFIDYSFAKVKNNTLCATSSDCSKTNIGGAIIGAGLGYRF